MKKYLLPLALLLSAQLRAADVDLNKSEFKWKGTKVTGEHVGTIKLLSAKMDVRDKKIKSAELVMNINSIDVTDLQGEWKEKFLTHIKGDDFFEMKKYGTAKLEVKSDDGKKLKADLTIKGRKHEVEIPYKKNGKSYEGKFTFDRTKFGVVYGSGSYFKNLGDKMIHDKVDLDFKVILK